MVYQALYLARGSVKLDESKNILWRQMRQRVTMLREFMMKNDKVFWCSKLEQQ